jgi:hypothetical protein
MKTKSHPRVVLSVSIVALLCFVSTPANAQYMMAEVPPGFVQNGNFEGNFVGGIAEGWIGHSGDGNGYFAENPKTGPIGGGLYGAARCWIKPCEEDVQTLAMSGKVHLVDLGRMDMTSRIREAMGADAIVVFQPYISLWEPQLGHGALDRDPHANGVAFADFCYQKSQQTGHWPRCYHGLVEPNLSDRDQLTKACQFELGFTNRMHQLGCRSCVLNHAPGTPVPKENMYLDEVRELLAVADYVGYHAYGGHNLELMCDESTRDEFSLRWREFAREYQNRGWRFPPVIYTEGTIRNGWIDKGDQFTPEMIRNDILGFAELIGNDPWAVGLCASLTGVWPMHPGQDKDITKYPERIIEPISRWNQAHPVDAHSGTGSQVIGGNGQPVNRSICQAVPTNAGERYAFSGWFKFEFFDCQGQPLGHKAVAQVGFGPTGQTGNPSAQSVQWSENMIGSVIAETDIYYNYRTQFRANGTKSSLWIRFAHPDPKPSTRLCIDNVTLRATQPDE